MLARTPEPVTTLYDVSSNTDGKLKSARDSITYPDGFKNFRTVLSFICPLFSTTPEGFWVWKPKNGLPEMARVLCQSPLGEAFYYYTVDLDGIPFCT